MVTVTPSIIVIIIIINPTESNSDSSKKYILKFLTFMEYEGSLLHSEQLGTKPYPESEEFS
jgi:hypothetical protein